MQAMRRWCVWAFVPYLGLASCSDEAREEASTQAAEACPTKLEIPLETPPDPGIPEAAPVVDCGAPSIPTGTTLRRHPYLQSVTQTSLMVAWTTTAAGSAKVRVGESKDGPWTEFAAASELFDQARTTDTEDYFAHAAAIAGLTPNRAYCYEISIDGTVLASGLTLNTAWEGKSRPVRILAFGDSGTASPEQLALRDTFMQHEFDLFLHLGDMAYSSGTFPEFEERVFGVYRDFLRRVPTFPTIGNHEYGTDRAQPYLDVYYLFEQALRVEDNERYYSFDYGNVHFVSLDSNGEMLTPIALDLSKERTDDMIDWAAADLAKSKADWKIAFFHHPPHSMYLDRDDNVLVIKQIMPVLEEGGVDLVLVGHDHHYVRSLPLRGECEIPGGKKAIPYIVVGGGGAGLTPAINPEDWYVAVKNDQVHAFLSLTLHGCKASAKAIGIDGKEIDSFEIDGCD
jgi:hypothetical protein